MTDPSTLGGATDPNQQPGGTPPNPPANPSDQDGDNGGQGGNADHMIPKSRFDEVNKQRKAYEKEKADLEQRLAEMERAQMSDQEKREADLKKYQEQAGQVPTLQGQIEQQQKQLANFSQQWLGSLSETQRTQVEAYAKAKGIEDPTGMAQEGMALLQAGLLNGSNDKPPKPTPPPTHEGQPGSDAPAQPPQGKWGAARAATRKAWEDSQG